MTDRTRSEQIALARKESEFYLDRGDVHGAYAAFVRIMAQNSVTRFHTGLAYGATLLFTGRMQTVQQFRVWSERLS